MQLVASLNQSLAQTLPIYATASTYAQNTCKQTLDYANKIYTNSNERVQKARKVSNKFTKQASWLLSQSADELLDLIEEKLAIEEGQSEETDKTKRIVRILNQIKETYIINSIKKVGECNGTLVTKGKEMGQKYILPLYFTLKATVAVSRQIMMECIAERLGQLKMTYQVSKDTITMLFSGEFEEEKVMKRVTDNIANFKQFTISFVQKGMEIKISKKDFYQNYVTIMEKITEIVKGVSTKSIEQWTQTKTKTVSLYNSVLARIKEKEIQIKTEYYKLETIKKDESLEQSKQKEE